MKRKFIPIVLIPLGAVLICIDALFMHEDDLLFTITTDADKNILNVDISSSKDTPPYKVSNF